MNGGKTMRKRFLALSFCLAMLCAVTGCGKENPVESGSTENTTVSTSTAPTYSGGVPSIGNSTTGGFSDGETTSLSEDVTQTTTTTSGQTTTVLEKKNYTFSAPILTGDKSAQLTDNPNRGFRLETYMSVENGQYTPELYDSAGNYKGSVGSSAIGWLYKFLDDYDYESPRVVQVYFYLTQYRDKALDQTAIDNMNAYFEVCRQLKVTIALRFAYVFNQGVEAQDCVSLARMKGHMRQLQPILEKNRDVLFCLEAGFFGEWGEQSPSSKFNQYGQVGEIMNGIVAMVPSDLWVVVRYAWVRNSASAANQLRIGYHNDYIVGVSHEWDSGTKWSTDTYQNLVKWSEQALVEGEMPWGSQLPFDINGWNVAKYLKTNHYTVLSCYHNNREGGVTYDMKKWRDVAATEANLQSYGLSCYPEWFKDSSGKTINRSLYEYMRDFLGYHVMSSSAKVSTNDKTVTASFSLKNVGFAAPLAMKQLRLVLLDESGKIVDSKQICKLSELTSETQKDFSVTLTRPDTTNVYRLGIYLEAPNGMGAKLANDLPMVNGVNILGSLD